jgi:predicted dehydrogenase
MFAKPLVRQLSENAKLCGIYDINPHRARLMGEQCGGGIPVFDDFDEMIRVSKPDDVIVTTIDRYHHEYIIRSLEAGCNAISEKPMTIDAEKCQAVLDAERKSGRKVTVTFNCRFMPYVVKVKELLASGVIGDIRSVHLEWQIAYSHGADYFRRWHRKMENSGGLLVHKATHHFDMVNWWVDDEPEKLYAFGDLKFFGPRREQRGERCQTCAYTATCPFYYDVKANDFTRQYYYEAEGHDGYFRDQCVFGDDIDIYDTMSVNVKYRRGALLSYSLTAYNAQEGWRAHFVGSEGRLEAESFHPDMQERPYNDIRIYNRAGELQTIQVPKATGGHGGGDERLRKMIFVGGQDDPLGQQADSWAGAMSLLIGAGANRSIATGQPVVIADLCRRPE